MGPGQGRRLFVAFTIIIIEMYQIVMLVFSLLPNLF